MSFANFGIGVGAFAQGLTQGMQLGNQINTARDQYQVRKAHQEGMANAKTARQSAIDELVQVGAGQNASNTMTMPTYQVEGQSFADEGSARKAAESRVGSVTDFFYQNEAPKIADLYMEQGDVEKAETWRKWIQDKNVQKGFQYGVRAFQAASMGDDETAIKNMVKMYNQPGYFEDGSKATGYKPVKGKDGSTIGYAITVKDAQGNDNVLNVEKGEGMLRAMMPFVDPKSVYEAGWAEITAERNARLKAAQEDMKFKRDIYRDDRRALSQRDLAAQRDAASLDRTVIGKQMDSANKTAAVDAKVAALKKAGYSDAFINDALPAMLGIGEYKKAAAPEEVRRMLHQARLSSDYNYARKSPQEQAAVIEQDMQLINGQQQRRNPMAVGMQSHAPAGRGPMILDTQTGQLVPYGR